MCLCDDVMSFWFSSWNVFTFVFLGGDLLMLFFFVFLFLCVLFDLMCFLVSVVFSYGLMFVVISYENLGWLGVYYFMCICYFFSLLCCLCFCSLNHDKLLRVWWWRLQGFFVSSVVFFLWEKDELFWDLLAFLFGFDKILSIWLNVFRKLFCCNLLCLLLFCKCFFFIFLI